MHFIAFRVLTVPLGWVVEPTYPKVGIMTDTAPAEAVEPEVRPDFASAIPDMAARMLVTQTYDLHTAYVAAYSARYGERNASFRQWRNRLVPDGTNLADLLDVEMVETLTDIARLSEDAAEVAALFTFATELVKLTKANLESLYHALHRSSAAPTSADGPDPVELRAQLDSMLGVVVKMAETPLLDADTLWSFLPHKRTPARTTTSKDGKVRNYSASVDYDGPSISTDRVPTVRENSTLAVLVTRSDVDTVEVNHSEGTLGANVKSVLRLSMSELREQWGGAFTAESFGEWRTIKTGDGRTVDVKLTERD